MQIYMPFLIRLSHAKFHRLYSELVLMLKNNWQHVCVCGSVFSNGKMRFCMQNTHCLFQITTHYRIKNTCFIVIYHLIIILGLCKTEYNNKTN